MIRALLLAFWLPLAAAAAGQRVALHDLAQLEAALKEAAPCCVVDARAGKSRKADPLPDALVYRADLKINPTSAVVVIGDDDRKALQAARDIAERSGAKRVIAVKGGLKTWKEATSPSGLDVLRFVIPSNTCQQDSPLQEFLLEKK